MSRCRRRALLAAAVTVAGPVLADATDAVSMTSTTEPAPDATVSESSLAATSATRRDFTTDELEAALLTPDEVGSGWNWAGGEGPIPVVELHYLDTRFCPTGPTWTTPTGGVDVAFNSSLGGPIGQQLLTFETRADLDGWVAALEACIGEQWEGDRCCPIDHATLGPIDVADHGDDRAGYRFLYTHPDDPSLPSHAADWYVVRLGDVLLVVSGSHGDLEHLEDEAFITDVLARAVQKAEQTLRL
jgi:hypothetical protein